MKEKTTNCDDVSSEICRTKHKVINWVFGVIFVLMTLFISIVSLTLASSNGVVDKIGVVKEDVNNIKIDLATHMARQEEVEREMISTLGELKESVDKNTDNLNAQMTEQRVLMEKILHNHP